MTPALKWRFAEPMPTVEERVAYLEGRLEDHSIILRTLRDDIAGLKGDVQDLRRQVEALGQRIDALELRIDALAQRLDSRIDGIDTRSSRQFMWLVGIQVATFVAVFNLLLRLN